LGKPDNARPGPHASAKQGQPPKLPFSRICCNHDNLLSQIDIAAPVRRLHEGEHG
jgi:hypothetical protein